MRCQNCGWENPDGSSVCEKCNSPLNGGRGQSNGLHSTVRESVPFETQGTTKTTLDENPTIIDNGGTHKNPVKEPTAPIGGYGEVGGGTCNPYAAGMGYMPIQHCKLSPVIFPGEDKRDVPSDASFKGSFNELNRANLDPENQFITSKVQAVLTNKDGKWYIQDKSAQKTTFVRADEPTPLKSGDIILMGNRTFIFSED